MQINLECLTNMLEGISVYKLIFNDNGKVIDGILKYMNHATVEIMDLDPEESIGKRATKLFNSEYINPILKSINRFRDTGQYKRFEDYYLPKDRYFLISGFEMPDNLFAVLRTDITEQKKAEEALKQSETILQEATRLSKVGAYEWNIKNDEFIFSREWQGIHGVKEKKSSIRQINKHCTS